MESVETAAQNPDNQKPGEIPASNGTVNRPPTPISPPYWQHQRLTSQAWVDGTTRAAPISLEDHTDAHHDTSGGLWARDISIEDYVVVRGGSTGIGAYVVWNCKVQTLDVRSGCSALPQTASVLTPFAAGRSNDYQEKV
jgi:hypothetical protein